MYDGPAAAAAQYFGALGHPCPQFYNPAEFLADLISIDTSSPEAEAESRCGPRVKPGALDPAFWRASLVGIDASSYEAELEGR